MVRTQYKTIVSPHNSYQNYNSYFSVHPIYFSKIIKDEKNNMLIQKGVHRVVLSLVLIMLSNMMTHFNFGSVLVKGESDKEKVLQFRIKISEI